MRNFAKGFLLIAFVFGSLISASGQQAISTADYVAAAVTQALAVNGTAPTLQRLSRSGNEVRQVISTRLNPKLLIRSENFWGTTLQFAAPNGNVEVSVMSLRYPSLALCTKNKKSLETFKGFFARSEMLTRFSATQLDNLLVIVSTENSGDARTVHAIDSLPEQFAADTKQHKYKWTESKQ